MDAVTLTVNGAVYGGWKEISISRSIETIAGAFELSVSERWPGQAGRRAIAAGASARVAIGGETVIAGYVDDVEVSHDAESHEIAVRGRDATGDLVDCSAPDEPGEWSGLTLDRIAAAIAGPFGIAVSAAADLGEPFGTFAVQPGETAFEAIERAARMRAVLPLSDGKGGLVLTRAGRARAGVTLTPETILSARGTYGARDRHSRYTVKGDSGDFGSWGGDAGAEASGTASDPGIRRHRPLTVIAEDLAEGISFADRALWEANIRAGRARRVSITLAGWRYGDRLWRPNELVRVENPALGVAAEMLIASVAFSLGPRGSLTELGLVGARAFDLLPVADKEEIGW